MGKKIIKPKLDLVFKKIFGNKDNIELLTDLLASVLNVEPSIITEIQITDNEIIPETVDKKYSRLDLFLVMKDQNGIEKKIDVEIQINNNGDFRERSLYYTSKIFSKDLSAGEGYSALKSTLSINIVDFNLFDYEDYHSSFMMYEGKHKDTLLSDKFRIDFIELPKARKNKKSGSLQKWVDFLNINTEEDLSMVETAYVNNPVIYRATAIVRKMSADEKMLYEAEKREETLINEQLARGYEREQGLIQGRKEGRKEERSTLRAKMQKQGYSEEQINKLLSGED